MIGLVLLNLKGAQPPKPEEGVAPDDTKRPSIDVLKLDECRACNFQAIDPLVLDCGHAVCRACVVVPPTHGQWQPTVCPIPGCEKEIRNLMITPSNWLAHHFVEPRQQNKCEICLENGAQKEAIFWCKSCSTSDTDVEWYCEECEASEHSSRNTKNHIRLPISQLPTTAPRPQTCSTHNLPQEVFCLDHHSFICQNCRDTTHKACTSKLLASYEQEIKQDLTNLISGWNAPQALLDENRLNQNTRDARNTQLKSAQQRPIALQAELTCISGHLKKQQAFYDKATAAALLLTKTIQESPIHDLLHQNTLATMKARFLEADAHLKREQSLLVHPPLPTFKESYQLKAKIDAWGGFCFPAGATVDTSGNWFVADATGIHKFSPELKRLISFGKDGDGKTSIPSGMAFDLQGTLYVADSGSNRIMVFDASGEFKYAFGRKGLGDGELHSPKGVAIDIYGNVAVVDGGHRLQVFTPSGTWLWTSGFRGEQGFDGPQRIAVDTKTGNFYITEASKSTNRMQILDSSGKPIRTMTGFVRPFGIAVDKLGRQAVVNQGRNKVQIFSEQGTVLQELTGFNQPSDLAVDHQGNLLVVNVQPAEISLYC